MSVFFFLKRLPIRLHSLARMLNFHFFWGSVIDRAKTNSPAYLVSLTSHGTRIAPSFYSILSIVASGIPVNQIHVWLGTSGAASQGIRKLQSRGLVVHHVKDVKSHTKWAYLKTLGARQNYLGVVLADDDLLYPRGWARQLSSQIEKDVDAPCVRTFTRLVVDDGELRFIHWSREDQIKLAAEGAHVLNHPFSGSGLFLPNAAIDQIANDPGEFLQICPSSDDLWLHRELFRLGIPIKGISADKNMPPSNLLSGASGLHQLNWDKGENHRQLKNAFSGLISNLDSR